MNLKYQPTDFRHGDYGFLILWQDQETKERYGIIEENFQDVIDDFPCAVEHNTNIDVLLAMQVEQRMQKHPEEFQESFSKLSTTNYTIKDNLVSVRK